METRFKVGDIVMLKLGSGPKMIVTGIAGGTAGAQKGRGALAVKGKSVQTAWFAGKKSRHDSFPEDTLTLVQEKAQHGSVLSAILGAISSGLTATGWTLADGPQPKTR